MVKVHVLLKTLLCYILVMASLPLMSCILQAGDDTMCVLYSHGQPTAHWYMECHSL